MKTEIYIATHKQVTVPAYAEYIPIHVGSALSSKDFGYCRDDTGDNISILNPNFCELTGLYWMYKHSQADILGLVHYRRYFMQDNEILNQDNFDYDSLKGSIILAKKEKFYFGKDHLLYKALRKTLPVGEQYRRYHIAKDWVVLKDVISENYPDYLDSFNKIEACNTGISLYNMIIGDAHVIKQYCDWLFDILFKVQNNIVIHNDDNYQKRVFGFMAERLLNIYFDHHKEIDVVYKPVKLIKGL